MKKDVKFSILSGAAFAVIIAAYVSALYMRGMKDNKYLRECFPGETPLWYCGEEINPPLLHKAEIEMVKIDPRDKRFIEDEEVVFFCQGKDKFFVPAEKGEYIFLIKNVKETFFFPMAGLERKILYVSLVPDSDEIRVRVEGLDGFFAVERHGTDTAVIFYCVKKGGKLKRHRLKTLHIQ